MPKNFIEDITQKISNSVPEGVKQTQKEIERNIKSLMEQSFNKMNLVTKEEFEITHKVLLKSREKIDALEKRVAILEALLNKSTEYSPNNTEKDIPK